MSLFNVESETSAVVTKQSSETWLKETTQISSFIAAKSGVKTALVGIVTGWRTDNRWIVVRIQKGTRFFLFLEVSRSALEHFQAPVEWVSALFLWV